MAFGISCGVVFAALLLVQQDRSNPHRRLVTFCASLMFWSALYLIGSLRGLRLESQGYMVFQLLSSAVGVTVFTYGLAVAPYFRAEDRIARTLLSISPIVVVIGLILIWMGFALTEEATLTPIGFGVLLATILYAVFAFWSILTSTHDVAKSLRLPSFLIVIALISGFSDALRPEPVGLFIMAACAALIGWAILRYQLLKPMENVTEELRVANRDLRQLVTDLATERSHGAELTAQLSASRQYAEYKSDFLNLLGHRLRTPLNSIVGYSELLESGTYGELTDKQIDRLRKIHRNSDALLEVINDMIDLNLIDAGQMSLKLHLMSMNALILHALTLAEPDRVDRGVLIHVDGSEKVHPVFADETRFPQALANVLRYALQMARSDLTLSAHDIQVKNGIAVDFALPLMGWLQDGLWVIVEVGLTANALSPESQVRLFEAFYLPSQREDMTGTGLELTIAKKLLELHQGTLWIKHLPENQVTFLAAVRAVEP